MNYRINLKCKINIYIYLYIWYKQINIRFVKQAEAWEEKKKSLSTSCDNDEDIAGIRVISIIDKGNFYLHLLIMMKMQPPTTYYM